MTKITAQPLEGKVKEELLFFNKTIYPGIGKHSKANKTGAQVDEILTMETEYRMGLNPGFYPYEVKGPITENGTHIYTIILTNLKPIQEDERSKDGPKA